MGRRPANQKSSAEQSIREAAYYLWENEGRPEGRALDHWLRGSMQRAERDRLRGLMSEEEKVLAGRADANIPAMLTKDVPGG